MRKGIFCAVLAGLVALTCMGIPPELISKGFGRGCQMAYYPSKGELYLKFDFSRKKVRLRKLAEMAKQVDKVKVELVKDGSDKILASTEVPVKDSKSEEVKMKLPPLDGQYQLKFTFNADGRDYVISRPLNRKHFAWEGNTLGISDKVFKPFLPVKADGDTVNIVLRKYKLNGCGMMSSIITKGEELLAGPMTLKWETMDGKSGECDAGKVKLLKNTAREAVYETEASGAPVNVKTRTTVEFDGCVKVDMELLPGKEPVELKKLWLDIPLKNDMATLFHEYVDGPRNNYEGATPAGTGVVWDSPKARRYNKWQNTFVPYIWLGGEERGLAWFAESDKGWITEKGGSTKPVQELIREGNRLTLRVYLANIPFKLEKKRELVFGLMVSPTKPMPEGNWRKRTSEVPGHGGSVRPWGGLYCAYKFPYRDDWQIVDKMIEGRETGKVDKKWFEDYYKKHNPPNVYGTTNWLEDVLRQAGTNTKVAIKTNKKYPYLIYFEEMGAPTTRPEWLVFQDEWGNNNYTNREWPDESVLRRGFNFSPGKQIHFPKTYRDYGAYYGNEWYKRGLGHYWDNCNPKYCLDTRDTAAYVCDEEGNIQPSLCFWNVREYQKRIHTLLHEWRGKQKYPLEWSVHMTNGMILPVLSLATIQLSYEWSSDGPRDPDFIRIACTGKQNGNYPKLCAPLAGTFPELKKHGDEYNKLNWSISVIHDLGIGNGSYQTIYAHYGLKMIGYGYGTDKVKNHFYWDKPAVLECKPDFVKWTLLARKSKQDAIIVLASWKKDTVTADLTIDQKVLGFNVPKRAFDLRTGEELKISGNKLEVPLAAPYGNRVVMLTNETPDENILFSETFEEGPDLSWSRINTPDRIVPEKKSDPNGNKVLHFEDNPSPWSGRPRVEYWRDVTPEKGWTDYVLSFRFRLGKVPTNLKDAKPLPILLVKWRGQIPKISQHGLSHTAIKESYSLELSAKPDKSWDLQIRGLGKHKNAKTPVEIKQPMDTAWHNISIKAVGKDMSISWDGKEIWKGQDENFAAGGFGIAQLGGGYLKDFKENFSFLEIDDIKVEKAK